MQKYLAKQTLRLVLLVFVLHILATVFYWYNSINDFDKVMHVLGGLFIALLGAMMFWRHIAALDRRDTFVVLLLFVVVMGLAWEYYEYIVQFFIKGVRLADLNDSITDLIADMFGGIIGTAFVLWSKKRYNTVHAK